MEEEEICIALREISKKFSETAIKAYEEGDIYTFIDSLECAIKTLTLYEKMGCEKIFRKVLG